MTAAVKLNMTPILSKSAEDADIFFVMKYARASHIRKKGKPADDGRRDIKSCSAGPYEKKISQKIETAAADFDRPQRIRPETNRNKKVTSIVMSRG
jgi:hypothetical protein